MRGPHFLPYLLLLPLGACLPLLDRSGSEDAVDYIGGGENWENAMDGIGASEHRRDAMDAIRAGGSWRNAIDGIGAGEGWRNNIDDFVSRDSWGILPEGRSPPTVGRSPPFVGRFPLSSRADYQPLLDLGEELQALRRQRVGARHRREDFTRKDAFQSTIDRKPPMDPLDHILRDKYPKRKEANIKAHYG